MQLVAQLISLFTWKCRQTLLSHNTPIFIFKGGRISSLAEISSVFLENIPIFLEKTWVNLVFTVTGFLASPSKRYSQRDDAESNSVRGEASSSMLAS